MVNPEMRLFCRLDRVKPIAKEKRRIKAIANLALLDTQVTSVFEQAAQTAARFLDFPVSFVGLMGQEHLMLKSLVSFSTAPVIHRFRGIKEIPRSEAFCDYVVDSEQVLALPDVSKSEVCSQSILFQHYGIAAYLAVPLLTSAGDCLGTLAVVDFEPRSLTDKQIEFLTLLSDWMMSEIQRQRLEAQIENHEEVNQAFWESPHLSQNPSTHNIKIELLTHLCQDLLTPLTSIKGMTSVLNREIYGTLNNKQKEYLEIINCSGKYMISLVEEILSLDILDESSKKLYLSSVDLEMLCQQTIRSVEYMAAHRQQKLNLSVPPEYRIWLLDKDKVRQMLYYLLFTLLQSADSGCLFEVVVWQQHHKLKLGIGIVEPENLHRLVETQPNRSLTTVANSVGFTSTQVLDESDKSRNLEATFVSKLTSLLAEISLDGSKNSTSLLNFLTEVESMNRLSDKGTHSRESLGLLLSYRLAELHGGQISIHQLPDYGCCYLVTLPQLIKAPM
ncbi:GAF domain-containing sensor histidine kinase [Merismopedia glauca]|uniref:histidine kinase n=1 Tax=Merismopedia glauca CCAP 1448/3 TaxID=1296344 RepID=A0A2T1C132_9CYAN|nr:GAF domain-containing sensor histidine kinase [Merismopedia glauca]PSB01952.1 histidine kinase [Merismopedia glauca CCAP 1448/3]